MKGLHPRANKSLSLTKRSRVGHRAFGGDLLALSTCGTRNPRHRRRQQLRLNAWHPVVVVDPHRPSRFGVTLSVLHDSARKGGCRNSLQDSLSFSFSLVAWFGGELSYLIKTGLYTWWHHAVILVPTPCVCNHRRYRYIY